MPRTIYQQFGEIGRNSYATVHVGNDAGTHREVAILQLHARFRNDPHRWPMVWDQVVKLRDAHLENVVPVLDLVEEKGWIVCERMQGNLQATVRKERLEPDSVRVLLRQALVALKGYHKLGICHGDIKPANLLYNADGRFRLSFSPGLVLGGEVPRRQRDFQHLIPETLNPDLGRIGPPADLYCLGFAALELMTGPVFRSFFRAAGEDATDPDAAWLQWHTSRTEPLPDINLMVPGIPDDLAGAIHRMVRKEVEERYQSAEAVLFDLREETSTLSVPDLREGEPHAESRTIVPSAQGVEPEGGRAAPPQSSAPALPPTRRRMSRRVLVPFLVCLSLPLLWFWFFAETSGRVDRNGPGPEGMAIEAAAAASVESAAAPVPADGTGGGEPAREAIGPEEGRSAPEVAAHRLPPGLIAVPDARMHPTLKLPTRVVAEKLASLEVPLELVLIEAGEFDFGRDEPATYGDLPARPRRVARPFYIAVHETTNAQYGEFANEVDGAAGRHWMGPMRALGGDALICPVVGVSLEQARAFSEWVSDQGRLPSEVEWEYAVKLGGSGALPWREGGLTPDRANLDFDDGRLASEGKPVPVTSLESGRTARGLFHAVGNVAELCDSLFEEGFNVRRGFDPGVGSTFVARGGSYLTPEETAAVTLREAVPSTGDPFVGFRIVVEVETGTSPAY